MCGKAMYHKGIVTPGDQMIFTIKGNTIASGIWGQGKPLGFNARIESMRTTWQHIMNNRGILELDGFYEKNYFFSLPTAKGLLRVPILYNKDYDFLVLTRSAKDPVRAIHERQPIMIKAGQEGLWLDEGQIIQMETIDLIRSKAA